VWPAVPMCQSSYKILRGTRRPSQLVLTGGSMGDVWVMDDGWWVIGDGWIDGQAKSKKIMYFKNISKATLYFFLVVSRPFRRALKTFSEKNSFFYKISNIFFYRDFFDFFIKKSIFSKTTHYFLLAVSRTLIRVFKIFSEIFFFFFAFFSNFW